MKIEKDTKRQQILDQVRIAAVPPSIHTKVDLLLWIIKDPNGQNFVREALVNRVGFELAEREMNKILNLKDEDFRIYATEMFMNDDVSDNREETPVKVSHED